MFREVPAGPSLPLRRVGGTMKAPGHTCTYTSWRLPRYIHHKQQCFAVFFGDATQRIYLLGNTYHCNYSALSSMSKADLQPHLKYHDLLSPAISPRSATCALKALTPFPLPHQFWWSALPWALPNNPPVAFSFYPLLVISRNGSQ